MLHAIDRKTIVAASSFNEWELADFLTSSTPDFAPSENGNLKFDPTLANRLLDNAGWERGADGIRPKHEKRLAAYLPFDGTNASRRRPAEQAQAQARTVGFDIKVELLAWQQLSQNWLSGNYDINAGLWSSNTADMLWLRYASKNITRDGIIGQNAAIYVDPAFNELVEKARISSDPAARKELYRQAQERLTETAPSIPFYGDPRTAAFSTKVHGVKFDYAYLQPYWFDVWLDE